MASRPVIVILGSGQGVGAHTASCFATHDYSVAVAARSMQDRLLEDGRLKLHVDLTKPDTINTLFGKGASRTSLPADGPLESLDIGDYERNMAVNITRAVIAVKEDVAGFGRLPHTSVRTFIDTDNKLNVMADPKALTFGIARAAAAHMVWDCSVAYRLRGHKFYFTNERLEDGNPARELIDPQARADLHWQLAKDLKQGPFHDNFVKGKGKGKGICGLHGE